MPAPHPRVGGPPLSKKRGALARPKEIPGRFPPALRAGVFSDVSSLSPTTRNARGAVGPPRPPSSRPGCNRIASFLPAETAGKKEASMLSSPSARHRYACAGRSGRHTLRFHGGPPAPGGGRGGHSLIQAYRVARSNPDRTHGRRAPGRRAQLRSAQPGTLNIFSLNAACE